MSGVQVALTGHRVLGKDFSAEKAEDVFLRLIRERGAGNILLRHGARVRSRLLRNFTAVEKRFSPPHRRMHTVRRSERFFSSGAEKKISNAAFRLRRARRAARKIRRGLHVRTKPVYGRPLRRAGCVSEGKKGWNILHRPLCGEKGKGNSLSIKTYNISVREE